MSHTWRTDDTFVRPSHRVTTPQESILLAFNTTLGLTDGALPTSIVSRLYLNPNQTIPLLDTPTLVGATIRQRIRLLTANENYLLRISFETGGNIVSMSLIVVCRI